ncbi:hypothetical protein [Streptomyces cyaneofuscatus]
MRNTSRTRRAWFARTLFRGICKGIGAAATRSAIEMLWAWLSS